MNRNQSISFLVFFGAAVLFAFAIHKLNENTPFLVAIIPVTIVAFLVHVIFYDALFAFCADEKEKGPVNATGQVKGCMLINSISIALIIVSVVALVFSV